MHFSRCSFSSRDAIHTTESPGFSVVMQSILEHFITPRRNPMAFSHHPTSSHPGLPIPNPWSPLISPSLWTGLFWMLPVDRTLQDEAFCHQLLSLMVFSISIALYLGLGWQAVPHQGLGKADNSPELSSIGGRVPGDLACCELSPQLSA
jgi:hypothetical protein